MEKFGGILICLAVTLVFYLIDKKRYLWWEFFIPVILIIGITFGLSAMIKNSNVEFTEYWGETIVSVYEEEPYNYWHHETCTRSYACGTDKDGNTEYCTETYDCSHQDDVGPSWQCKTNLNNTYNITEHKYDSIRILWGTPRKAIGSHENYDSGDRCVGSEGTKFQGKRVGNVSYIWQADWPGTDPTRKGYFSMHKYENRVKASDLSLFNISVVTEEEADSLGLFKYPVTNEGWFRIGDNIDFPTILGGNVSKQTQENFRKLNAKFGPTNKLRLWVLIFDKKPASIAAYQENYWVKGNKNELVICIGTNGQEITWTHAFSWALSAELTSEVAQKVLDLYTVSIVTKTGQNLPIAVPVNNQLKDIIGKGTGMDTSMLPKVLPLNLKKTDVQQIVKSKTPLLNDQTWAMYYDYLNQNLHRFEKRSFEEFSYLKVELKTWQVILIYVLSLVISVGINFWTFNNEFVDGEYGASNGYYNRSFKTKFRY